MTLLSNSLLLGQFTQEPQNAALANRYSGQRAIAISYLDRQTLPWRSKPSADIPFSNQQFSNLDSAFLLTYGLMYVGGGKLLDASARGADSRDHDFLVAGLRQPRSRR